MISAFASRSLSTDPKLLGDLTISMLEGDRGVLRKEFDKLLEWLADEPVPDVDQPAELAADRPGRPAARGAEAADLLHAAGRGLFLDGLIEPYRSQAIELIRRQVADVDRFIAVSDYYVPVMAGLLAIPRERIAVVPLGINLTGYERARAASGRRVPRRLLRAHRAGEGTARARRGVRAASARDAGSADVRLEAAGYLAARTQPYLDEVDARTRAGGPRRRVHLSRRGRSRRQAGVPRSRSTCCRCRRTYDEPKGVFLLEAMASGVPVVQPRRGAFTEIVEKTGGGLLVAPDDPDGARRRAVPAVERSRDCAKRSAERGFDGVRAALQRSHRSDRSAARQRLRCSRRSRTPRTLSARLPNVAHRHAASH